ncbi:MAG: RNA 2'-phosphotransferase [Ferruginibacter sp.]
MSDTHKHISKFLSLVLRHKPEEIDLKLDSNGWADTDVLIEKLKNRGFDIDFELLEEVVTGNDKQRFSFNEDYSAIRANQGHSVDIDLALDPAKPPEQLYHGTVAKFIETIKTGGLQKMSRQHVHLSRDIETAKKVGARRGKPVILVIDSGKMSDDGYVFYVSENGVWLTEQVPVKYISF